MTNRFPQARKRENFFQDEKDFSASAGRKSAAGQKEVKSRGKRITKGMKNHRDHRRSPKEVARLRKEIMSLWARIPEDDKGELAAHLLDNTGGFRQWDSYEGQIVSWLRFQFENAGIKCRGLGVETK